MPRRPRAQPNELAAFLKAFPHAKALGIAVATAEVAPAAQPGAVVCEGTIIGRAVPWRVPKFSRSGGVVPTKDRRAYEGWKATVAAGARVAMAGRPMYGGAVRLEWVFYMKPKPSMPDTSNLGKGAEDGLQGVVFANDKQVREIESKRVVSRDEVERAEFRVVAL